MSIAEGVFRATLFEASLNVLGQDLEVNGLAQLIKAPWFPRNRNVQAEARGVGVSCC